MSHSFCLSLSLSPRDKPQPLPPTINPRRHRRQVTSLPPSASLQQTDFLPTHGQEDWMRSGRVCRRKIRFLAAVIGVAARRTHRALSQLQAARQGATRRGAEVRYRAERLAASFKDCRGLGDRWAQQRATSQPSTQVPANTRTDSGTT